MYTLLDRIHVPADLKHLSPDEQLRLASEIRSFLVETLNTTGGHLASNLGTVELAIALHTVFHTPEDRIIWDVGHQAYPHKILTGRKHQFATLKQWGGIAPFPSRAESIFDVLDVGHSSTSISAGLGMAMGFTLQDGPTSPAIIPVIGDGALGAGMAFEALNHAGALNTPILVILNDNDMSINPNVGALSNYFARLFRSPLYQSMRHRGKKALYAHPKLRSWAQRTESHFKNLVVPGALFEELGFSYIGPIDGHDLPTLISTLRGLQTTLTSPRLLHVITRKGQGFAPAERDPIAYHAVTAGFLNPLPSPPCTPSVRTYSEIFGKWLCDAARGDPKIVAITPAMGGGSGLTAFSKEFPDRYFDVGIAEQHAVTYAAGLASVGHKPVVAIYATFLQRAYDQLIHDVALPCLPVLFAIDRAGLSVDGPTHAGVFDISFLRCIPNLCIMVPSNASECRRLLQTGLTYPGPSCVRYPRESVSDPECLNAPDPIPIGQARIHRRGQHVLLLCFGPLLYEALPVAQHLNATLVDMRFVKPLDSVLLHAEVPAHALVVTLEEHVSAGGAGSAVGEWLLDQGYAVPLLRFAIPDTFLPHGPLPRLREVSGLTARQIQIQIEDHPAFTQALETFA